MPPLLPYLCGMKDTTTLQDYGIAEALKALGLKDINPGAGTGTRWSESDGEIISSYSRPTARSSEKVKQATADDYEKTLRTAEEAFKRCGATCPHRNAGDRPTDRRTVPEIQGPAGQARFVRDGQEPAGRTGEVQEMIDICDFAVGLSRQLYGLTMHSERPKHRMYEQWHPLGIVGIISAFNFPVAVWSWNAAIAWVCGDVCIWKPSSKVPLCAVACQNIIASVLKANNVPEGVSCVLVGNHVGDRMNNDKRVPLVSFTGSTRVGRIVSSAVAQRFGKSILELGGNNAIIVSEHSDLNMVLVGTVFGAVGTAGQRCTSTRRLIVHESVYDKTVSVLQKAYAQVAHRQSARREQPRRTADRQRRGRRLPQSHRKSEAGRRQDDRRRRRTVRRRL